MLLHLHLVCNQIHCSPGLCKLSLFSKETSSATALWRQSSWTLYTRGPQPLGCGPVPVRNGAAQQEVSNWRVSKPSPAAPHRLHYHLNHSASPLPHLWKNCLSWNWSLVPKMLGTATIHNIKSKEWTHNGTRWACPFCLSQRRPRADSRFIAKGWHLSLAYK